MLTGQSMSEQSHLGGRWGSGDLGILGLGGVVDKSVLFPEGVHIQVQG